MTEERGRPLQAGEPAGICPDCGGPRVWRQNRNGRWAECNACKAAKARAQREPGLVEAVQRLLAFGVPMGGNAGELVCSYCGQPWEQVQAAGHREGCHWIVLRDALMRENLA